jgi:hypothetical protein
MKPARVYGYEGLLVAALFATVIASLQAELRPYEVRRTVELTASVAGDGQPLDASAVRRLDHVATQSAERIRKGLGVTEKLGSLRRFRVRTFGERRVQLFCRADSARAAQQACDLLVHETLARVEAARLLETFPARRVSGSWSRLFALAVGSACGLGWLLVRVSWRRRAVRVARAEATRITWTAVRADPAGSVTPRAQPPVVVEATVIERADRGSIRLRAERPARSSQWVDFGRTAVGLGPGAGAQVQRVLDSVVDSTAAAVVLDSVIDSTAVTVVRESDSLAIVSGNGPAVSIVAYDVASGWEPGPDVAAACTQRELAGVTEQLFQLATRGCFVLRVVSGPECEDSKSSVAAQLAWMLAEPGRARVLLMEADFERPAVHRVMQIQVPAFEGFSQQLQRRDAARGRWSVLRCAPSLDVLAEGRVRTLRQLDSARFARALAEQRCHYDLIVVDGPALDTTHESGALDSLADGVLLVTSAGSAISPTHEPSATHYASKALLWHVRTAALPQV